MDLSCFPFDEQDLNVSLVVWCRRRGKVPVTLSVSDKVFMDIRERGFMDSFLWELDRTLTAYTTTTDLGGRQFPTMTLGVHVLRKPSFVLKAVALPISAMSLLSFIQFSFRYEHINDRVTGMLTLVRSSWLLMLTRT